MKNRSIIFVLTLCYVLVVYSSCKQSNKHVYFDRTSDMLIKATNIPISKLGKNYKSYQGKYIQTTGRFYRAFEVCCIGPLPGNSSDTISFFWVHIPKDLDSLIPKIHKTKERIITIKGRIDTTHKGHLSQYLATIENISFWEE